MVNANISSEKEVEYIKSQHLARISIVSPEDLQPDVSPVGFDFDGEYFYIGGINFFSLTSTITKKSIIVL